MNTTPTTSKRYKTDLTDAQWNLLRPLFFPWWKGRGRGGWRTPEQTRRCLDAIFYVNHTGCQWDMLPHDFPPKSTIHDALRQWTYDGTLTRANDTLRRAVREEAGRNPEPSAAILDSQSVKCSDSVPADTSGYDAGKKTKGRKRHLLVDVMGLVLGVHVGPASTQEKAGGKLMLCLFLWMYLTVRIVFADAGYRHGLENFADAARERFGMPGLALQIVEKEPGQKGFTVLPMRWVVERTFGWLMKNRRLARDYEKDPRTSESFILLAMIRIMGRRLAQ